MCMCEVRESWLWAWLHSEAHFRLKTWQLGAKAMFILENSHFSSQKYWLRLSAGFQEIKSENFSEKLPNQFLYVNWETQSPIWTIFVMCFNVKLMLMSMGQANYYQICCSKAHCPSLAGIQINEITMKEILKSKSKSKKLDPNVQQDWMVFQGSGTGKSMIFWQLN